MKPRHIIWIITGVIAAVAISAGVAVLVNRYLNRKKDMDYIECDCEPDPDIVDEAE
ncbi:MAG: hypothetical protein U0M60_12915 [Clostridia bacterium]|nr:hypothetical protein [Clostridia bacterium]